MLMLLYFIALIQVNMTTISQDRKYLQLAYRLSVYQCNSQENSLRSQLPIQHSHYKHGCPCVACLSQDRTSTTSNRLGYQEYNGGLQCDSTMHTYIVQDRQRRIVGARAIVSYVHPSLIVVVCEDNGNKLRICIYILSPTSSVLHICPFSIQVNNIFILVIPSLLCTYSCLIEAKLVLLIINDIHC